MFRIISDNFFVPLASPNKQIYWECVCKLFTIMNHQLSFGVERDVLVEELQYYFEQTNAISIEGEDMVGKSNRDKANWMLRRLEYYGWIEIEADKSYVQRVSFQEHAVKLIKTLLEISEGKKIEYQGYIYTEDGYPEFELEYIKLKDSELLSYEEKVENARQSAEAEFREQFLSKLQENMKNAQTEFKELNKALKDISFSHEKYEFLFMPSKRYRHYYEMIMDNFNAIQGESIFSGIFHQNHREVIDELFERLALDNDNTGKACVGRGTAFRVHQKML